MTLIIDDKIQETTEEEQTKGIEIPIGYKMTELGLIPDDWEIQLLKDLVHYINGKAHENLIKNNGRFIVVNSKFISTEGGVRKYSDYCYVPASLGEILMVMSDVPNGKAIAKCFFVDKDNCYTVNQRICVLHPKQINAKLLFYKLNRNPFYLAFDDGAKQTNLRKNEVLQCPISIPKSIKEQSNIAAALSDIDSLINSLDQLIAKKRNIKLATMQQLLTGKQRLPGFNTNWKLKRFGDVLKVRHGRSQKEVEVINGKYPILASGGEIGRTNNYLYDKPSVLIGRKGTIDSPQYIESPFWTVDTLFFTEISNCAFPKFIFYKFNMVPWLTYSEASGVPSLNASTIEGIEFSTPSCLEEQFAIAKVLYDLDIEISSIEQQLAKARNLKQGMMQELLTGRIRLK